MKKTATTSAAPWVAVHTDLWTSMKLQRLARLLKVSPEAAVGHLLRLWHSQVTANLTGELAGWEAEDLATAANWPLKSAQTFALALEQTGWLHVLEGRAGYMLHEWTGYGGSYLRERKASAERKRAQRSPHQEHDAPDDNDPVPETSQGQARDIPETSHATGQERTGQTGEDRQRGPAEGERSLAAARADVVREGLRNRNASRAANEVDRPQSVDDLLEHVGVEGVALGKYLADKFPLFDGKGDHPSIADKVGTLWEAFLGKAWAGTGRECLRWLVTRLSEDHQKLRQSEMIIGEKRAKGITLPTEQSPAANRERDEEIARWKQCLPDARGLVPDLAQWRAAGRPTVWGQQAQGSGAAPRLVPSPSAANQPPVPTPAADDVDCDDGKARFAALAAGVAKDPPKPPERRRPPVAGAEPSKPLTKAELDEMRAHSPEARRLADELERVQTEASR